MVFGKGMKLPVHWIDSYSCHELIPHDEHEGSLTTLPLAELDLQVIWSRPLATALEARYKKPGCDSTTTHGKTAQMFWSGWLMRLDDFLPIPT